MISLFTNDPQLGDIAAFNRTLCGLYAAGLGGRCQPNREDGTEDLLRSG